MALPPPIVLPQAASFRLIITQTLPLIFPNTRLLIIALGPLLAAADANNGLIPAGPAGVALQAGLAFAGWFFRLEFNRFIQRYVLGIGWPAVLAANDPRLTRYCRFIDANRHLTQVQWLLLRLGIWPPRGVPIFWPEPNDADGYGLFHGVRISRVAAMYNNFQTAMLHPLWESSHLPIVWGADANGLARGGTRRDTNVNDMGVERRNINHGRRAFWLAYMVCLERARAAQGGPAVPPPLDLEHPDMPDFPSAAFMAGYNQQQHIAALNMLNAHTAQLQPAALVPGAPPTVWPPGRATSYWATNGAYTAAGVPRPPPTFLEQGNIALQPPAGAAALNRAAANGITGYNV